MPGDVVYGRDVVRTVVGDRIAQHESTTLVGHSASGTEERNGMIRLQRAQEGNDIIEPLGR